jgi:hypothetical protein
MLKKEIDMSNKRLYLAKGRTVFGKFLICSSLLTSTAFAQSWQSPAFENWADPRTGYGIAFNIAKWFGSSLSDEDKKKHQQIVLFALNSLDPGQTAVWHNNSTDSEGKATIAVRYATSGGTCCRIYSFVRIKNNQRTYSDTACIDGNSKTWTFVDKY